ncbi:MAG: glycerophosphodiester phosphodiesterase family protein [Vagococcus sp.]|uniref:glycerophosphodiester phosphodiesterase family protein n=1 Tax=Vagococcus TaxID=2737 RepID=UPI002FC79520
MTLIFAHRGSKGTRPENTLSAFKEAIDVKADGIELDVQFSLDEELVVIHDGDVNRTTNGAGLVKELTLEELKTLDAGSWFAPEYKKEQIPTFDEVLELLRENNYQGVLNVEIKTDEYDYEGIEASVLNSLEKYPLTGDILLSSFNTETMTRVIGLNNTYEKAIILDKSKRKIAYCLDTPEIGGMHSSIEWIKENQVQAEMFKKHLRPWTVNTDADMDLCFDLELTAFHTDFPKKAMTLKEERYGKK